MLLLIILLLGIRYSILTTPSKERDLVFQEDPSVVRWIDSLQQSKPQQRSMYSYNPNFLTDYQGYMLGLSPEEIDRIYAYRSEGGWINTEEELKASIGLTDERLASIAVRLRFDGQKKSYYANPPEQLPREKTKLRDINKVNAGELRKVRGIGPVLSERIIKFRDRLGGFQVEAQLYDVYGLDREVAEQVLKRYGIIQKPDLHPININLASAEEIASLVYFSRDLAQRIIVQRERYGPFKTLEELTKIEDFPSDKIERISLYLSL